MTVGQVAARTRGHTLMEGDFFTFGAGPPIGAKGARVGKYRFISLSFWPFGARTPPRPQPPHPWRLAVDTKRAAMRPLTF
jgi:hypothetical protein